MRKIMDFILTPEMVKAIKQVEDGKGVQFLDCDWSAQEISNVDIHEVCYTYSRFKDATVISPEQFEGKKKEEVAQIPKED